MIQATQLVNTEFEYETAFAKNLGFVSPKHQQRLRTACVGIAGLGGTGGTQLQALCRLGIGRFTLADFDAYELINFNRQAGATVETIGRRKTEVSREIAESINPDADVRLFDEGIHPDNVDDFLDGVDVVIDSLDFNCFEPRLALYAKAREKNVWVVTAPPLGFGYTLLLFDPHGMRYEDYFDFHLGMQETDRKSALLAGINPGPLFPWFWPYLDQSAIDINNNRMPSLGPATFLVAGAVAAETANLLLRRYRPRPVPYVTQFDALRHIYRRRRLRWGVRSPWQRIRRRLIESMLQKNGGHRTENRLLISPVSSVGLLVLFGSRNQAF